MLSFATLGIVGGYLGDRIGRKPVLVGSLLLMGVATVLIGAGAGKLGVEQLDLLILHQALPSAFDRTLDAYRALEKLLADGRVRAIGVSNFMPEHLDRLLQETSVVPAVNQVELHPYFQQTALQRVDAEHGSVTQAWSPIGGITSYRGSDRTTFDDPTLLEIAHRHGKSAAQVMLRWGLQRAGP